MRSSYLNIGNYSTGKYKARWKWSLSSGDLWINAEHLSIIKIVECNECEYRHIAGQNNTLVKFNWHWHLCSKASKHV